MAKKTSQLNNYTTPVVGDYLPIVQASGPSLLRVTIANLITTLFGNIPNLSIKTVAIDDAAVTPDKWTNPYKFSAYPSANQTGFTSGTNQTVAFNSENYDTSSSFNTSTYKFVAPVSGYYHFDAHIRLDGSLTTGVATLVGSSILKTYDSLAGSAKTLVINGDSYLAAGASVYVVIIGYTSSGTWQITADSCMFSGHLISVT